jgi:hypothetical protein
VRKLARRYCKEYIMVDLVGEQDTGELLFEPTACWVFC